MKHLKEIKSEYRFLLLIFCISGCGSSQKENTKTESSKKSLAERHKSNKALIRH